MLELIAFELLNEIGRIESVSEGICERDEDPLFEVIALDLNPEGLTSALREDLEAIHDLHFALSLDSYVRARFGFGWDADRWLESQEGAADSSWTRVRPSILEAAIALENAANQLAPEFVSQQGRILVEVLPPGYWRDAPDRYRSGSKRLAVLVSISPRWDRAWLNGWRRPSGLPGDDCASTPVTIQSGCHSWEGRVI